MEHKPSNILVTGGMGFIGAFVVQNLVAAFPNAHIYNLDKLDYCASGRNDALVRDAKNYTFIKGDITSYDFVVFVMKEKMIDTIMHLAASTHVDNSFKSSFEFTKNNVMGTHVLLEASRVCKPRRFIHVSTDEVYGELKDNQSGSLEESIMSPTNPYSATKAAAECLVKAYGKSFNLPVIITRSNNAYGPLQYPEKIIPKFICRLLRNRSCFIHGDGSNKRRYLYVEDVASALVVILQIGQTGEIYNIGTDFEISNLDLAKKLIHVLGLSQTSETYIEHVPDRAFNDRRYAVDYTKIMKLGWRPLMPFEEGLRKTVEWYKVHHDTWWSDISCIDQAHPDLRRYSFDNS